ncbi:GNAT family N-acetyltransferase [Thalassospira sp. MA62]|nr:GNAT family N-acetyltransferase [Thalassospira sp. MA62]
MESAPTAPNWLCCQFDEMTARQVHDLLRLRQEIFVIEQNCIFAEIDGLDPLCTHILGMIGDDVIAAARIVAPGLDPGHDKQGDRPAIGRVVTNRAFRGQGAGRQVMLRAIARCAEQFPGKNIYLNGQLYLKAFYESLGFRQEGGAYEEDGIPHISMELKAAV